MHLPLPRPLVLGSTSVYRRQLLERLGLSFTVAAPGVDETPQPGEAPAALAARLGAKLAEVTPKGVDLFVYGNSGSDANDTIVKLVRLFWNAQGQQRPSLVGESSKETFESSVKNAWN